eukprot:5041087-Pleurochrysis_carterae.AAC.2
MAIVSQSAQPAFSGRAGFAALSFVAPGASATAACSAVATRKGAMASARAVCAGSAGEPSNAARAITVRESEGAASIAYVRRVAPHMLPP